MGFEQRIAPALLIWDHREQPDWDEITVQQAKGLVFVSEVLDTGGDVYAVVCSETPFSKRQAQAIWDLCEEEALEQQNS